jgi:hypothetical protein
MVYSCGHLLYFDFLPDNILVKIKESKSSIDLNTYV